MQTFVVWVVDCFCIVRFASFAERLLIFGHPSTPADMCTLYTTLYNFFFHVKRRAYGMRTQNIEISQCSKNQYSLIVGCWNFIGFSQNVCKQFWKKKKKFRRKNETIELSIRHQSLFDVFLFILMVRKSGTASHTHLNDIIVGIVLKNVYNNLSACKKN